MSNDSQIIEQVLDMMKIKVGHLLNLVAVIGLSYHLQGIKILR